MSDESVFEKVESDVTDVSEAETPDPRHDEAGESSPQEGKPKRKPAAIAAGAVAHDAHPRRKQSIGTQHLGAVSGCRMRAERCMATEPTGLIFFDIDGTLTRGVSSGTFIADRLGIGEQMRAAEEAYARGEMDNAAVCRVDAAGYAGLTVAEVETWLDDMPLIDGIDQALALCREHRSYRMSLRARGRISGHTLHAASDLPDGAALSSRWLKACSPVASPTMPMGAPSPRLPAAARPLSM